jgi:hypothetical protein
VFPTLKKTQQFRLESQRHLSNLVEEQRSPVSRLDPSNATGHRPGKSSSRVAKEFRFEKRLRDGRAIDRDHGFAGPFRKPVQPGCNQLLA